MNPKEMVMNYIRNNTNPFYANLLELGKNGKTEELENIAKNMCNQRNMDYNQAFSQFKGSYAQTINQFFNGGKNL